MKKLLLILITATPVFAQTYNYSYFLKNVGSGYVGNLTTPNGETASYIAPIKAIQFGGSSTTAGNVAVGYQDGKIKAWATGYENYNVGTIENQVDDKWRTPENLIGAVTSTDPTVKVCSLGNGGSITLKFATGIGNGSGIDFAVFENGFDQNYLELAFVEVSSNGRDFVRFPNFYLGTERIYEWLQDGYNDVMPTDVYNLASKYESGVGHGFDLQELVYAKEYISSSECAFTEDFKNSFLTAYDTLDLNNVQYVRIIDIYGDGNTKDSIGHAIYDPTGDQRSSPGVDLKGVAVLNMATVPEPAQWAMIFGVITLGIVAFRKRTIIR